MNFFKNLDPETTMAVAVALLIGFVFGTAFGALVEFHAAEQRATIAADKP